MKKLNIASTLTNISDSYIEEARDMPLAKKDSPMPKISFWQKLSDIVNSPLGVACICAVVALGVLAGIVVAGRNASGNPSHGVLGQPSQTHEENSSITDNAPNFNMSFTNQQGGMFKRGETYTITTHITNVGEAFTYSGSSSEFFAEATLIYHSGQTYQPEHPIGYEISGNFAITEDYVVDYPIPTGKTGTSTGTFFIPDDAPVGQYDLKLSYGDEYEIYTNAVSIYDEERFAFAYQDLTPVSANVGFSRGGSLTLTASVTNLGESFKVYEDHSDSFVPTVKFVCRATGYTFYATTPQSDDIITFIVGELETGTSFYHARIPEDADVGYYDLVLSYGTESRTFYEVICVTEANSDNSMPDYTPSAINSEDEAVAAAKTYIASTGMALPVPVEDLRGRAYYYENRKEYWVYLEYYIADILTDYKIEVTILADGRVTEVDEESWDENSYFVVYNDKDVRAAVERLCFNNDIGSAAYYFEFRDGKLYVCCEVIVSLTPPPGQEDGGCGIDHDHVFYKEEVHHES